MDKSTNIPSLQNYIDNALRLHAEGYNCSQSVVMTFADELGIPEKIAAKASSGLGGGVGACGEVCGVVTGMAICEGFAADGLPADKPQVYKGVKSLAKEFENEMGYLRCLDLKGKGKVPCDALIEYGVKLMYRRLHPEN